MQINLLDIPETTVRIPFYESEIDLPSFAMSDTPITVDQWNTVATTYLQVKIKIAQVHSLNPTTNYLSSKHLNPGTFFDQCTEFLRRVSQYTGQKWTICSEAQSIARNQTLGVPPSNLDIRMWEILADGYLDRYETEGYFDQEKKCWISKRGRQLCHSMCYSETIEKYRSSVRWGSVFYPRIVFRISSFDAGHSHENTLNFLGVKC